MGVVGKGIGLTVIEVLFDVDHCLCWKCPVYHLCPFGYSSTVYFDRCDSFLSKLTPLFDEFIGSTFYFRSASLVSEIGIGNIADRRILWSFNDSFATKQTNHHPMDSRIECHGLFKLDLCHFLRSVVRVIYS